MNIIKQALVCDTYRQILLSKPLRNGIGMCFSNSEGGTWLNGVTYPAYIIFDTEQDLLFFMIKFPDVLKFPTKESDVQLHHCRWSLY